MELPPARAFELFTPSGERLWSPGWDPQFPIPPADETNPGTVFTVSHDDHDTVWTVTRSRAGEFIEYSVTTPRQRAGLVQVSCSASPGGTAAAVSYDLTSLNPGANDRLEQFAANYTRFLAHWQHAIAATGPTRREETQAQSTQHRRSVHSEHDPPVRHASI